MILRTAKTKKYHVAFTQTGMAESEEVPDFSGLMRYVHHFATLHFAGQQNF
jgi:hypothetical protein